MANCALHNVKRTITTCMLHCSTLCVLHTLQHPMCTATLQYPVCATQAAIAFYCTLCAMCTAAVHLSL